MVRRLEENDPYHLFALFVYFCERKISGFRRRAVWIRTPPGTSSSAAMYRSVSLRSGEVSGKIRKSTMISFEMGRQSVVLIAFLGQKKYWFRSSP